MLIPCADQGAEQLPVLTESTTRGYTTRSRKTRGIQRARERRAATAKVNGGIISSPAVPRWLQFVFGRRIKRQRRCVICNLDNGTAAAARIAEGICQLLSESLFEARNVTGNLIFRRKHRRPVGRLTDRPIASLLSFPQRLDSSSSTDRRNINHRGCTLSSSWFFFALHLAATVRARARFQILDRE